MLPSSDKPASKPGKKSLEPVTAAALFIALISLMVAAAALRWSWAVVDEQVAIRKDYADMREQVDQLKIQFDFWDKKAASERAALQTMLDQVKKAAPVK